MEENITRYWFDTEFMEDGTTIELLSIGMVCDDGREFYAENAEANLLHANEWVLGNVVPHLHTVRADLRMRNGTEGVRDLMDLDAPDVKTRAEIAGNLLKFVNAGEHKPEFWAYYGDYDWVVLCQLYGRMVDLPRSWPKFAMDVKQVSVMMGDPQLPPHTGFEHNALHDARWTKAAWTWLLDQAVSS